MIPPVLYGRGSGIQHTEESLGRWLAKNDNRSKVVIESKCCNPYMDRNLNMYEEMPRVSRTFMYDDVLLTIWAWTASTCT